MHFDFDLPLNPKSPVRFLFADVFSPITFSFDEGRELKAAPRGVRYETSLFGVFAVRPGELPLNHPDDKSWRDLRVNDLQLSILDDLEKETKIKKQETNNVIK